MNVKGPGKQKQRQKEFHLQQTCMDFTIAKYTD